MILAKADLPGPKTIWIALQNTTTRSPGLTDPGDGPEGSSMSAPIEEFDKKTYNGRLEKARQDIVDAKISWTRPKKTSTLQRFGRRERDPQAVRRQAHRSAK